MRRGSAVGLGLALLVTTTALGAPPFSLARLTDNATSSGSFTAGALHPPTGVTATGGSSVVLGWTASVDAAATGYVVERATTSGGSFSQIGTKTPVGATSYTDNPSAGLWWYRLSTYLQNWRSATTTPVSGAVTTTTGEKACVAASNSADTGGDGNGYESNPTRACVSDSSYAVDTSTGTNARSTSCSNTANDRHRWWGYAFGLPGTVNAINGITVRADLALNAFTGTNVFCVQLSWDGGTTWTATKQVTLTSASKTTYILGTSSDTWGRTWAVGEFTTTNFRIRVIDATDTNNRNYQLDYLTVAVQYTP
jgi:hypothetical protein